MKISICQLLFSPNNDGINDELKPLFNNQIVSSYRLNIFDRWGNKLVDILGENVAWNGIVDNRVALNGTYLWTLEFKNEECDLLEYYSGNVSLVK